MTLGNRGHSARGPLALVAAAGLACAVGAQPIRALPEAEASGADVRRPDSARRLLRVFTFEEPSNPYPIPDHWVRAQDDPTGGPGARRPGFPWFNQAEFDRTMFASGGTSVRLPTKGGSTSLRLNAGELPIFPDADYTVSAKVRTTGLEHARAFLVGRLLDQRLAMIPGSEVRSEPVLSPEEWTTVAIDVPGKWASAAWLQIDLELLQPEKFLPPPPEAIAQHIVNHTDISGSANFDDVTIALLPRTRFWTDEPTGVFIAPQTPTLRMLARDQGGEELRAGVRLIDVNGRTIAQRTVTLDPSARVSTWTPRVPAFGWYRAVMDIDAGQVNVSRSEVWFNYLPAPLRLTPSTVRDGDLARFGLIADDIAPEQFHQLPALVERARTRFVVVPAFDASVPLERARESFLTRAPVVERLLAQPGGGQEVTLAVGDVPAAIAGAATIDSTDALAMAALEWTAWFPYVEPALDVFGQRILRYQLGHASDVHAMKRDPRAGVENFERNIARLVPGPRIALPWRGAQALPAVERTGGPGGAGAANLAPGPLVDSLTVTLAQNAPAGAMEQLAAQWRARAASGQGAELTVVPELPDMARDGARARAVEAGRRIAEFWRIMSADGETASGSPARLALESPWRRPAPGDREDDRLHPGPALAVLSIMAERLAGRRVIAPISAAEGVHAFLIAEHAGRAGGPGAGERAVSTSSGDALVRACVVAWNESAAPEKAWVDVYPMAGGVDVVDMFGNSTRASISASDSTGVASQNTQVRVALSDAPVFIEGVDPYLAQLTASLRLTPTFIPSVVEPHEHRIEATNPWPVRITGQIQLKDAEPPARPKGPRGAPWTISPNVIDFAAAPGETVSLPVTISFGPGQLAGSKDMVILARVLADRQYPAIRAETTVTVGLTDLELVPEITLGPTPTGPDAIVTAAVTNRSARARTLRLEVASMDRPTQRSEISDLPPNQTVYKEFVFRDAARAMAGRYIRVTLGDDDSAARLSRAVLVPVP
ncbi:MAG TPA: hypothetical protein PKE29_12260 [Phycisphaerales bacterium]|nr:hypothetical protein [Phycisphaerales bacterium]